MVLMELLTALKNKPPISELGLGTGSTGPLLAKVGFGKAQRFGPLGLITDPGPEADGPFNAEMPVKKKTVTEN